MKGPSPSRACEETFAASQSDDAMEVRANIYRLSGGDALGKNSINIPKHSGIHPKQNFRLDLDCMDGWIFSAVTSITPR